MSQAEEPKNNIPRNKWAKRIKYPISQSQLLEKYSWDQITLSQKFSIFFSRFPQVIKEGIRLIFNRQRTGLISDKWFVDDLSIDLADYLHWYVTAKGFLHSIDWMGIPTRKIPMDMWIYQEIIAETKPDIIIEIGAFYGGSTLFLAQICDCIDHGKVISVDISHDYFMPDHPRIRTVTGDSSKRDTVDKVTKIVTDQTVMLIHDGDHNAKAVLQDLELYGPLVSSGHYLIVEDGIIDLFNPKISKLRTAYPKGGPLKAVRKYLKSHPEFERDRRRERFIISTNQEGFLRRK